jgi:hypothetical protein
MKISSILSVVLLIAAVSMTTVSGWTQLNVGDGGLSRWKSNCRLDGKFMTTKSSSPEQCGGVCIAQSGCTHFTHGDGTCFMYNAPNGKAIDHPVSSGWVCGYIPDRINWGR